jgi:hypothetical protein
MCVAEQAALWEAFATVAAAFTRLMPVLLHCAGLLSAGSLMVFLLLCWALAVVPLASHCLVSGQTGRLRCVLAFLTHQVH